jgi:predicted dehydrogenase
MAQALRVGIIGAGANTRLRHIPGLRAQPDVALVAVCNRRPSSTAQIARDFNIPRTFEHWQDLVADPNIDAVVIGTWPYLHCAITIAALEAGKHVLTEARMSMNVAEARQMLDASRRHSNLVAQIVPSPFALKGDRVVRDMINAGYLGDLRDVQVSWLNAALADPVAPLSWRQDAALSGYNTLALGIVHETVLRWAPKPVRVLAQAHAFIPTRIDPESGVRRPVGTPDHVQVLAILEGGARAIYQCSGVAPFGQKGEIWLVGSDGVIVYDALTDRIYGCTGQTGRQGATARELDKIPIPADKEGGWRVEEDFVHSIRTGAPVRLTDFSTGVTYMEFTEAVARSAQSGSAVELPLEPSP